MQSSKGLSNPKHVKGWILDIYPSALGEFAVWIITEDKQRLRLTDSFRPKIYVSGKEENLDRLTSQLLYDKAVATWDVVQRCAKAIDAKESKVLEIVLKDSRMTPSFTRRILRSGKYLQYQIFNCDLKHEQMYFYSRDVFPLAFVEIEAKNAHLEYNLLDSVENADYPIPPLRILEIEVNVVKRDKITKITNPIDNIVVKQGNSKVIINSSDEAKKLLELIDSISELDPDIIVTKGGDSYLFPYLVHRAAINGILKSLILGRENIPLMTRNIRGKTFFSYGRTFYRAPMRRLYGRVHVDKKNTFIIAECGLDGLFEIARICRVSLHTAARSSIGSSMSSIQFYQAFKNNLLIPRNKGISEAFKSSLELLVGDRGGLVFEPEVGVHDDVGEVDFSSMYPTLMINNNISAETVLCKCCPDSNIRIPELNYNICEKRIGIVPKSLESIVNKRRDYKRLKLETQDKRLREVYDNRQTALKWILVTCFGYLGYKNAKFGTVDGHMAVCALGRETFLKAAKIAEEKGFKIIHGIVDSLWLKKKEATNEEYSELCKEIYKETNVPLSFEGRYSWIVFLPSKMHPSIGVLNRYYGVMENGKIKARGLELRRRDTPQFISDAQNEMLEVLAEAKNTREFVKKIPDALRIVQEYRERLLMGKVPVWDLIITKHLSKNLKEYKQMVSQVIAAKQLLKDGVEVAAGKNVKFLFTSAKNKHYERRVIAEELIEKNTNSDIKKYLLMLYASAATMFSPFGYSINEIYNEARGHRQTRLTA